MVFLKSFNDSDLNLLVSLDPPVHELNCLDSAEISDDGIRALTALCHLGKLVIGGDKFTGVGFGGFRFSRYLIQLIIQKSKVTDEGVAVISKLISLEILVIDDANEITDEGVVNLGSLVEPIDPDPLQNQGYLRKFTRYAEADVS